MMKLFRKDRREGRGKVFCVGLGKTGTTSIGKALTDIGYRVGSQENGELLFDAWIARDFEKILEFCETADAFQDIPFCLPYTFQAVHQRFPKAKFILSKRRNAQEWWESLTRYHAKLFTDGERLPERKDLETARYRYPGFLWKVMRNVYPTPEDDVYEKEGMLSFYDDYNSNVKKYFESSTAEFLELNVADRGEYERFCRFLGQGDRAGEFPWENKT